MEAITHLLNYTATNQNTKKWYKKIEIILHIHRDGSYLSTPESFSRIEGHFFLSENTPNPTKCKCNGPKHIIVKILKNIMGSASEEEIGGGCTHPNSPHSYKMPITPNPTKVDNSIVTGFTNKLFNKKIQINR